MNLLRDSQQRMRVDEVKTLKWYFCSYFKNAFAYQLVEDEYPKFENSAMGSTGKVECIGYDFTEESNMTNSPKILKFAEFAKEEGGQYL